MSLIAKILPWSQIILSVLLIMFILLQKSGAGIGGALGGDSSGVYHTKRGFEKFSFYLTIIIAVLFALSAFVAILL